MATVIYHCVCYYVSSKLSSSANTEAVSAAKAAEWARRYFTTIALTIQKIEVYAPDIKYPVYTLNFDR